MKFAILSVLLYTVQAVQLNLRESVKSALHVTSCSVADGCPNTDQGDYGRTACQTQDNKLQVQYGNTKINCGIVEDENDVIAIDNNILQDAPSIQLTKHILENSKKYSLVMIDPDGDLGYEYVVKATGETLDRNKDLTEDDFEIMIQDINHNDTTSISYTVTKPKAGDATASFPGATNPGYLAPIAHWAIINLDASGLNSGFRVSYAKKDPLNFDCLGPGNCGNTKAMYLQPAPLLGIHRYIIEVWEHDHEIFNDITFIDTTNVSHVCRKGNLLYERIQKAGNPKRIAWNMFYAKHSEKFSIFHN